MQEVYRGIWVISYRELLRFSRQRSRVLGSFGMPLLLLAVFGAGFNRTIGNLTPGVDFLKFVYPGIITMTVLMSSLFAGLSVVWDREFGFLREVLVAPLSRTPARSLPSRLARSRLAFLKFAPARKTFFNEAPSRIPSGR